MGQAKIWSESILPITQPNQMNFLEYLSQPALILSNPKEISAWPKSYVTKSQNFLTQGKSKNHKNGK